MVYGKEWFNGCVANGLQFRLDGYMITNSGVTYHIGIKNISAHKIEIGNKVYFRFNSKERRKKMSSDSIILRWEIQSPMRTCGIMTGCVM